MEEEKEPIATKFDPDSHCMTSFGCTPMGCTPTGESRQPISKEDFREALLFLSKTFTNMDNDIIEDGKFRMLCYVFISVA